LDKTPFWVIADHIRTLTFAISDGAMPGAEGRGYVLRRLLRRASRFGRNLGLKEPVLYKLSQVVIDTMSDAFPELSDRGQYISNILKGEEERFESTLDNGLRYFERISSKFQKGQVIPGSEAFKLYDSYGFPLDLTTLLAEEKGLIIDEHGFENELNCQRQRARLACNFKGDMTLGCNKWNTFEGCPIEDTDLTSDFTGYDKVSDNGNIIAWKMLEESENIAENIAFILNKTPFYAESGGQVSDCGSVTGKDFSIEVTSVRKETDGIVHYGILKGELKESSVNAIVSDNKRIATERNHTATHLLHSALRAVLGDHARQSGSYVGPDRLRFDYTHFEKPDKTTLSEIEKRVNRSITKNFEIHTGTKAYKEALSEGVTALFGEKYTDTVRVVRIDPVSSELCGGTHVKRTGEIGLFIITSEESVGAGVRRIEALTGEAAIDFINHQRERLYEIEALLKTPQDNVLDKIRSIEEDLRNTRNALDSLKRNQSEKAALDLLESKQSLGGISFIVSFFPSSNKEILAEAADSLRSRLTEPSLIALVSNIEDKASLVISVSPEAVKKGINAQEMIKIMAKPLEGGGGGRADFATAGGKRTATIEIAINAGIDYIKQKTEE
jgi:alanyl-tRNA synthetase